MDPAALERYAELIVRFAANVQPGQVVEVGSELGKEELTRAIARAAYRAGAAHVSVTYDDLHVKRARILHAPDAALGYAPDWVRRHVQELSERHGASIYLAGAAEPGILDDLDTDRLGRDRSPEAVDWQDVINARTVNWTVVPAPTAPWAVTVHPEVEPEHALERLWEQVFHVCRIDEDDPVAAWQQRSSEIRTVAGRLTGLRLDSLRFRGPGTDLTVGLLPTSRWMGGGEQTVDGIEHMPNLPTEEVFTTPDPARTSGVVRATKPLEMGGTTVRDLQVRFDAGRAVEFTAASGADALQARTQRDQGGAFLGEVALVDREGRIAPLDTVFFDSLLDENASSHIALGSAYESVGDEDLDRINRSEIHIDFMIGGDGVAVTGTTAAGDEVPILIDGGWAFD
ncbi:MAG TPA: aminopeptidase [Gaiellales bacterium]|nr:aminopeptidase [Gaiellales bacterium]